MLAKSQMSLTFIFKVKCLPVTFILLQLESPAVIVFFSIVLTASLTIYFKCQTPIWRPAVTLDSKIAINFIMLQLESLNLREGLFDVLHLASASCKCFYQIFCGSQNNCYMFLLSSFQIIFKLLWPWIFFALGHSNSIHMSLWNKGTN